MTAAGPITTEQQTRIAEELQTLGSATLAESGAHHLPPRFRAVWPGAALAAPAVPVQCSPGDNLAIHVAAAEAPAGSALVVDVGGVARRGYWGEVLTTMAQSRGLVGLVIDGGVRDVAALRSHNFPVFSTTVSLPGATKEFRGTVGAPIRMAGTPVAWGDWVVGDVDGVVIVPGPTLDAVLESGRARTDKEAGFFEELRAGRTTIELLGLDTSSVSVELPGA
jgi:4-hydroxy-4-methyl-2-oxoglutarate aldolase